MWVNAGAMVHLFVAADGVPRLSPRSKAVRASARAHSREGGPRSASGGGSSGRTSANVSPDKPRGAGAAAGGGGSSSGGGGGGSAMRSRAGLPPRSSQSPPGCAVRKAAAAAAGKGRASGADSCGSRTWWLFLIAVGDPVASSCKREGRCWPLSHARQVR